MLRSNPSAERQTVRSAGVDKLERASVGPGPVGWWFTSVVSQTVRLLTWVCAAEQIPRSQLKRRFLP